VRSAQAVSWCKAQQWDARVPRSSQVLRFPSGKIRDNFVPVLQPAPTDKAKGLDAFETLPLA